MARRPCYFLEPLKFDENGQISLDLVKNITAELVYLLDRIVLVDEDMIEPATEVATFMSVKLLQHPPGTTFTDS